MPLQHTFTVIPYFIFQLTLRAKDSEVKIGWIAALQSQLTNGGKYIIVESNSYHYGWAVIPAPIKYIY